MGMGDWTCTKCTFINVATDTKCQMCGAATTTTTRGTPPPPIGVVVNTGGPPPPIGVGAATNNKWDEYGLTQYEYDGLCALFINFDADDSGEISRNEAKKLATWLNFAHSPADIDGMFRQMDKDNSGSLSRHEFCSWVKDKKPDPRLLYGLEHETYRAVLMQFHTQDKDNNGLLNEEEMARLCRHMGAPYPTDGGEIRRLFVAADLNRNGTIDLHELLSAQKAVRK